MARLPAFGRRSDRAFERHSRPSAPTWLLSLAHDACRRHLLLLGSPLRDDELDARLPPRSSTLTCDTVRFALSRELDGRLSWQGGRALRRHIRDCRDCARLAAAMGADREAVRRLAGVSVPRSLGSPG